MTPEEESLMVDAMFDRDQDYAGMATAVEVLGIYSESKYGADISTAAKARLVSALNTAGEDPLQLVSEICASVLELVEAGADASMVGVVTSFMGMHAVVEGQARQEGQSHLYDFLNNREAS